LKEELEEVKKTLAIVVAELEEAKKTVAMVVGELWRPKALVGAETKAEPKPESKQIVLDFSVFMGFVGLLIGVVLACMWK
jgi:hypothetical protein